MPGEQHPIPQQITSYEFKLIGDMTIKQFGKAAAGIIGGFLVYSTPLFILIKLPLALAVGGLGLAAAFIPFGDRPLEKIILAFVRSLYSPTLYSWKKQIDPNWLDIDFSKNFLPKEDEEDKKPKKDAKQIEEYLNSIGNRDSGQIRLNDKDEDKKKEKKKDVLLEDIKQEAADEAAKKAKEASDAIKTESLKINDDSAAGLNLKSDKRGATNLAEFGDIPMPDKPTVANILVGMVLSNMGKIVSGAIIEVQDEHGNASRVLKSNPLGQFRTSTPLASGSYVLITGKDGFSFDRVKINLTGNIVEPVLIRAT